MAGLKREDLLTAAEVLAAVLDGKPRVIEDVRKRDPVGLEWIWQKLRMHATGKGGEPSWQPGLAAAALIKMMAEGQPMPRIVGRDGDMIASVVEQLTALALSPPLDLLSAVRGTVQ